MNPNPRHAGGPGPGGAGILGTVSLQPPATDPDTDRADAPRAGSPELFRALAEVKGQAQFLLYLADQIEDSLHQLADETDSGHSAFLCKLLGMYSAQLESKHQGLGDKIAETCQEVYVTVREYDLI
ncbi:MAG TPA: hypothetical protein VG406_09990 [Isosphaeraceae bacterium]|jgi:hypothetical protein|nr:hypothetical protein [Isosphaeraceae bacterium]